MGIFSTFVKGANINDAVKECKSTKGAILIDVREQSEFGLGHIPGAVNMPLNELNAKASELKDKKAPLYVYCQTGARAVNAVNNLKSIGFTNVNNIGGIARYKGDLEKSKGRSF